MKDFIETDVNYATEESNNLQSPQGMTVLVEAGDYSSTADCSWNDVGID